MRCVTLLLWTQTAFLILPLQSLNAQQIAGQWHGAIDIAGSQLGIDVNFTAMGDSLRATIDIPQQGAHQLALTNVRWGSPNIHFELPAGPGLAVFDGVMRADTISGDFRQAGFLGKFSLRRAEAKQVEAKSEEPVPYAQEEVKFRNGDVTLAGTLTIPRGGGTYPAVVMITGSGAQNRDEELFGFKPFREIADHLTRKGIAVLRCDDRGVGGSTGSTSQSTTEDFAGDVSAAVALLKSRPGIDHAHIGLCGHSEGGIVAPIVAARSRDVAFIILIAGTAVPGDTIVSYQVAYLARSNGATDEQISRALTIQHRAYDVVKTGKGWEDLRGMIRDEAVRSLQQMSPETRKAMGDTDQVINSRVDAQLMQLKSPWLKFFLSYDPAPMLEQVRCPVLALFGELDRQVPVDLNREPLEHALKKGGNKDYTVKVIPKANHLFLAAKTGSPMEYASLTKEFVPGFLDLISDWILKHVRRD
jgi:pimeloyl-ACP methyl ester carboxylesterase